MDGVGWALAALGGVQLLTLALLIVQGRFLRQEIDWARGDCRSLANRLDREASYRRKAAAALDAAAKAAGHPTLRVYEASGEGP